MDNTSENSRINRRAFLKKNKQTTETRGYSMVKTARLDDAFSEFLEPEAQ